MSVRDVQAVNSQDAFVFIAAIRSTLPERGESLGWRAVRAGAGPISKVKTLNAIHDHVLWDQKQDRKRCTEKSCARCRGPVAARLRSSVGFENRVRKLCSC